MDEGPYNDFRKLCTEKLLEMQTGKTSIIVSEEKYQTMVEILSGRTTGSNSVRHWIKKKWLKLVNIPQLEQTELVIPKSKYARDVNLVKRTVFM